MREIYMHAATTVSSAAGTHSKLTFQALQPATVQGHARMPAEYHSGVRFGISAWNSWGTKLSDAENAARSRRLKAALLALEIAPTSVKPW
jgi:hypothetical protein